MGAGTLNVSTNYYIGGTLLKNVAETLTNKTINGASNTITVRIANDVSGMGAGVGTALTIAAGAASGFATLDGAGKLNTTQIPSSLVGAVVYQGIWNATTNSPALASGVGTKGFYYKVGTAGTTSIDGNANWRVGDTIIFDGTTWDALDGTTSEVISVAGLFGVVSAASLKTALAVVVADISDFVAGIAAAIHAATGKTTPVDADEIGISDSAASFGFKKLTWANLKATLKTYFDTLYATLGAAANFTTIAASSTISATGAPATAAHIDTSGMTGIPVTGSGGNAQIAPTGTGSYLMLITETAIAGFGAVYLLAGGTVVLVSTDASGTWIVSTSPGAGKLSVGFSGGAYKVFNNFSASTATIKVTLIKAAS